MHQHVAPATPMWGALVAVNSVANLAIVGGYFLVPLTALPRLIPWNSACPNRALFYRSVRVAGVLFFLTCGIHHLYAAFSAEHALSWGLVVDEVIQAFAIWWFVLGFSSVVRYAARRSTGEASPPKQVQP